MAAKQKVYVLSDQDEGLVVGVFSTPHEALARAFSGQSLESAPHARILRSILVESHAELEVVTDEGLSYSYAIRTFELDGWY